MNSTKILIVSRLVWDDNSNSNTLTNLFDGYNPDNIARIYIETKRPNTTCCHKFYQISEVSLIRKLFNWKTKTGQVIDSTSRYKHSEVSENREQSLMSFVRQHRSIFFTICRDILWSLGGWKTKELKAFIKDFDPDVIWLDGSPLILMNRLNNYVAKIAKKPTCTFLMDDVYTYKSCSSFVDKIYRFFLRKHVKKTVDAASHVFVASEKMKVEYDTEFSINSTFLAKGIDSVIPVSTNILTSPIKLVYLGNVLIGRLDSLILLSEAINEINKADGNKYKLSIYTSDYIPVDKKARLLNSDSVQLCAPVPYSEVAEVISNNDVVVFVEALEGKQNRIARLSFSTKIVDYIGSGKCILTIGPSDLAPVEYLRNHNISIVASTKEDIFRQLNGLTPQRIEEIAHKTVKFAKEKHSKHKIQNELYQIIKRVALD